MRRMAWILLPLFALALLAATWSNVELINKSRESLSTGVFRDRSGIAWARSHVVIIVPETDDSFIEGFLEGARAEAPLIKSAIQVFAFSDDEGLQARRFFDMAVLSGADGVIMYVKNREAVPELAQIAAKHGTVFIPFGNDTGEDSSWGFIGTRSLEQGYRAGKLIGERIGSSARVGIIIPAKENNPFRSDSATEGVKSALSEWPGAVIAGQTQAREGILSGEEAALTLLKAHPEINAIFCSSIQDTLGAAQVIIELNLVGKVNIIGSNESPELNRLMEKGIITATVAQDSRILGRESMRAFGWRFEGLIIQ